MREEERFELEVHVAPICFRKSNGELEVLIAKRSPTRKLYPNKWECGGGQVRPGENFEEAAKRQIKQELDVDVEIIALHSCYEILAPTLPQKKIPGIQFVCRVTGGEPKINSKEHTEWCWHPVSDLDAIGFLSNLRQVIADASAHYQ